MRTITDIKVLENYTIIFEFSNGEEKLVDLKPFLCSEVFQPLKNTAIFSNIKNQDYFVSWLNEEVDLSADTLWNIGKETALFES